MRKSFVEKRIDHICIMVGFAVFFSQITQIPNSMWIPITVTALIGQFHPGLCIEKAGQRIFGTVVGLVVAIFVMIFLRYSYEMVFLSGIIFIYVLGLVALQSYFYVIAIITVIFCINYNYMDIPVTDFDFIYFFVNRFLAVVIGVMIFYFFERFIFKRLYINAEDCLPHGQIRHVLQGSLDYFSLCHRSLSSSLDGYSQRVELLVSTKQQLDEILHSANKSIADEERLIAEIYSYLGVINKMILMYLDHGSLLLESSRPSLGSLKTLRIVRQYLGETNLYPCSTQIRFMI